MTRYILSCPKIVVQIKTKSKLNPICNKPISNTNNLHPLSNEIVIFKPSSGEIEFQVILDGKHETVWMTQQQMMDLFEKARRT